MQRLIQLYPDAIVSKNRPFESAELFNLFYCKAEEQWIAIPKENMSDKELALLGMFFEYEEPVQIANPYTMSNVWYQFLFLKGHTPEMPSAKEIRMIQFHVEGTLERNELESAFRGFFSDEAIFVWENRHRGVVIEQKNLNTLQEHDMVTMAETLEADFFTKTLFYIGKYTVLTKEIPLIFQQEQEFFHFAIEFVRQEKIFSFEKVFPTYLAHYMSDMLKSKLNSSLTEVFTEDPDMYATIRIFLENNLNASLTAKKLYIHRNTLQYRIDKFSEKTGIQLKEFHGAFTVYLSCLLFSFQGTK